MSIETLISRFNLRPHPEGGHYARTFQSSIAIKSLDERYNGNSRPAGTSIHYLLSGNDFSALHKLRSDEIWYYHHGDFLKIHVLDDAGSLQTHLLGNALENPSAHFQLVVPAGNWFAAEVANKNSYCFVSCSVCAGFEFEDFEMAEQATLSNAFPQHKEVIERFTRVIS
jgi:predicted cupin superfamily sugar epimerase